MVVNKPSRLQNSRVLFSSLFFKINFFPWLLFSIFIPDLKIKALFALVSFSYSMYLDRKLKSFKSPFLNSFLIQLTYLFIFYISAVISNYIGSNQNVVGHVVFVSFLVNPIHLLQLLTNWIILRKNTKKN